MSPWVFSELNSKESFVFSFLKKKRPQNLIFLADTGQLMTVKPASHGQLYLFMCCFVEVVVA